MRKQMFQTSVNKSDSMQDAIYFSQFNFCCKLQFAYNFFSHAVRLVLNVGFR